MQIYPKQITANLAVFYYVGNCTYCSSSEINCQIPLKNHVQIHLRQINVNLVAFYYIGCCTFCGSSEFKCQVGDSD